MIWWFCIMLLLVSMDLRCVQFCVVVLKLFCVNVDLLDWCMRQVVLVLVFIGFYSLLLMKLYRLCCVVVCSISVNILVCVFVQLKCVFGGLVCLLIWVVVVSMFCFVVVLRKCVWLLVGVQFLMYFVLEVMCSRLMMCVLLYSVLVSLGMYWLIWLFSECRFLFFSVLLMVSVISVLVIELDSMCMFCVWLQL